MSEARMSISNSDRFIFVRLSSYVSHYQHTHLYQQITEPYIQVAFNFDSNAWKLEPNQFFSNGRQSRWQLRFADMGVTRQKLYYLGGVVAAYWPFNALGQVNTYPNIYAVLSPSIYDTRFKFETFTSG